MTIHIRGGDIHLLNLRTRMPFKYGIATMTSTPHALVRVHIDVAGRTSSGIAADVLPPKWFTKNPQRDIGDEVIEMAEMIQHALAVANGLQAATVFDLWRMVWDAQAAWGAERSLPPLLVHFGTSLVERALIEAYCRHLGQPFWRLLRENHFGIRLGVVHTELAGHEPAEFLPETPLTEIIARHTVGLADPLEDADIPADERLDDGLPQSLAACIETYGLRHFKIKVVGQLDRDRERLCRIAQVIRGRALPGFAFSLDGNEQFHAADDFVTYWQEITTHPQLQDFFRQLLFVEQPFHRDQALNSTAVQRLRDWPDRPRMIIDESDGELCSLPQALELGYAGTSHKNCKGVIKGVANACLLAHRQRRNPAQRYIISGEDLANIGPVALLQDLAVCAALGIASVERNGHHYFAGLSMFPQDVREAVLRVHGDLYRASRAGWPTLAVHDGKVPLQSINAAAFGVGFALPVEQFDPLDETSVIQPRTP